MSTIPIVIDSRLRVPLKGLPESARRELEALFTHDNPKRAALEHMGIPAWKEPREFVNWGVCVERGRSPSARGARTWVEKKRGYDGDDAWMTFPRGGIARVREAIEQAGCGWEHVDERALGDDALLRAHGSFPESLVEMRPYQLDAIEIMHARQNVLVRGATGSGKTESVLGLFAKVGRPALVVVHSAVLFDQWIARVKKTFGLSDKAVGRVRGSKRKLGLVTVAMQRTLAEMPEGELTELLAKFGVVAIDEVQSAAAKTVYRVVDACPAKWRIGVSDSERRKDRLDVLIHDLLGQSQHEISREEMIAGGYVLEVEVRVVPTAFEAPWYGLADEGSKWTAAAAADEEAQHVDYNRLLDEMRADEDRNLLAVEVAVEAAREGRPTIVMTHRRDHAFLLEAEISARGVRTGLVIGGADFAPAFKDTIARFRKGRLACAVGTVQAVGTGLDLPTAQVGVVATPVAGNKQLTRQVWGRFCRNAEGKQGATLYYLWDRLVYPGHLANLIAWCPVVRVRNERGEWEPGRAYLKAQREFGGI